MKRFVRLVILVSLVSLALAISLGGLLVWYALEDLPDLDVLKNYQPPQSTMVLDRNGQLIGRFYDERRTVVEIKSLPRYVPLAFVAAEDGDFFEHRGIDYFALLRAIGLEIKFRTVGGRRVGGSTITQQTARAMLLSTSQTYVRKIKEMVLAQRIEKALSKEQILHLYLNQIYFGNGAHGIEEAALTYFGKSAKELKLFEAAALASVPKSPIRINPFGDTERLRGRQAYVLEQMVKHGYIKEKDAKKAQEALLFSAVSDKRSAPLAPYFLNAVKTDLLPLVGEEAIRQGGLLVYSTLDKAMQSSAEHALSEGLRTIDKRAGFRGPLLRLDPDQEQRLEKELELFKKKAFVAHDAKKVWNLEKLSKNTLKRDIPSALKNIGLLVPKNNLVIGARVEKVNDATNSVLVDVGFTRIDMPFSALAWAKPYDQAHKKPPIRKVSEALKNGDIILVKLHDVAGKMWASLEQEPLINGGLVSLDVKSGGVLAMVGGYDFAKSPFNRIMQAKRQPGSGIKPIIYGQAIDLGLVTTRSLITDAPRAFLDPGTHEFWRPRNHTNKFLGDITLRRCLRSSINICTISLLEMIGLDKFLGLAKEVELATELTPYPRNLTIALGSGESYPINVANAMRILANGGLYSSYSMINGYKLSSGEEKRLEKAALRPILRPESAFIITNILQEVISYRDKERYLSKVVSDIAGKTGTTNNARSVWFIGWSPKVLTLVFVGYDDNRGVGSDEWGVTTAFPIWANYMNDLPIHHERLAFEEPSGIEWRTYEVALPHGMDSHAEIETRLVREPFILGSAPVEMDGKQASDEAYEQSAFAP